MKILKRLINYFSKFELILWASSVFFIVASFLIFKNDRYLTLVASLLGVTSLIFCAKGNPVGQLLMVIFGLLYGYISYTFSYYGEMITYLGMTLPMAAFSLVSWLRNPYNGNKAEVKIKKITRGEVVFMLLLSVAVTVVLYFVLAAFDTANLIPSTVSVTSSFIAAYLTFKRSPWHSIAYVVNDLILISLWILASFEDRTYISVVVCFFVFLANDTYSFINWRRIQRRQES